MTTEEHFSLRLARLKAGEQWSYLSEGLVILIFKSGAGSYCADDKKIPTTPGDVLVLADGTKGKLLVSQAKEVVFLNFSLCLEHLFPLFASGEIGLLEDVLNCLKTGKLLPAASPLAKQVNRLATDVPPTLNLNHRSQLLRVAAAILTEEFKAVRQSRAGFVRTEDRILQVFEKLSTDELLNLSIAELATKFGCSRRHLSRLSQQCLGRSIASLKMEMRLMKAASCLRNPEAKIINVAAQCGFNHLGLFNACFKRRFGASPGKWRNAVLEKTSGLSGIENNLLPSSEPGSARILLHLPAHDEKPAGLAPEPALARPGTGKKKLNRDAFKNIAPKSRPEIVPLGRLNKTPAMQFMAGTISNGA